MSAIIARDDHPDKVKKSIPCLGCGEPMWTDRCHRICKRCQRRNNATPTTHAFRTVLPRGAWPAEASAARSFLE